MSEDLKPISPERLKSLVEHMKRERNRRPHCGGGLRLTDGQQALRRVTELEKRVAELERLLAQQQEARDA